MQYLEDQMPEFAKDGKSSGTNASKKKKNWEESEAISDSLSEQHSQTKTNKQPSEAMHSRGTSELQRSPINAGLDDEKKAEVLDESNSKQSATGKVDERDD